MKEKDKIKEILIVEDHPLMRLGLKKLIEEEKDFKVCGEATNSAEATKILRRMSPSLVIIDIRLSDNISGLDLVRAIKHRYPLIPTLILSMFDETLYAERAIKAGAKGFISKSDAAKNIIYAMRKVIAGELYLNTRITSSIVNKFIGGRKYEKITPEECLTDREYEIFQLIGKGIKTKEIAQQLNLSINTIESHRRHIKEKLNIKNANLLMKFSVQWSLLHNCV